MPRVNVVSGREDVDKLEQAIEAPERVQQHYQLPKSRGGRTWMGVKDGARMRKRAKQGSCEGRKPYGFYEGEGLVPERMKALRAEGLGFDHIAGTGERRKLATRTGRRTGLLSVGF